MMQASIGGTVQDERTLVLGLLIFLAMFLGISRWVRSKTK